MNHRRLGVVATVQVVALIACAGTAPAATPTEPPPPPTATATEVSAPPEPTAEPTLSYAPAVYEDAEGGFAFNYPSDWTLDGKDPAQSGSRGYYVQMTSWPHPPGDIGEVHPAGGTALTVTVQLWDPVQDLDAFAEQRKTAWDASGFPILAEEELTLKSGQRALAYTIQSPDHPAYFLLTTLGDRYLVLSGSGDVGLLAEIGSTLEIRGP
jgi:hypothetical protein